MVSQYVWIAITVGVFFAGLGGAVAIMQSTTPGPGPTAMQQMMQNPDTMNQWMGSMMNDPQAMQQMHDMMMSDPQHMNQMMGPMMNTMMNDPYMQQQMMNHMMDHQGMMNSMMENHQMMGMMSGNMTGMMGNNMMGNNMMGSNMMGSNMMGSNMMGSNMMGDYPFHLLLVVSLLDQRFQITSYHALNYVVTFRHHMLMKDLLEHAIDDPELKQ